MLLGPVMYIHTHSWHEMPMDLVEVFGLLTEYCVPTCIHVELIPLETVAWTGFNLTK